MGGWVRGRRFVIRREMGISVTRCYQSTAAESQEFIECGSEFSIGKVNPDARDRSLPRSVWHQWFFRENLIQIFVDNRGFPDNVIPVLNHWNFTIR